MTSAILSCENPLTTSPNKQWPQWLATMSGCLGLFCAGMNFAWSSPSLAILQSDNSPFEEKITNDQASWIASLLQFGSVFSPIAAAFITKYFGPKRSVLFSTLPYFTGFVILIFATRPFHLYVSRIVSGIAIGFSFSATPIYIAEISENHNRGSLMVIFSLLLNLGSTFVSGVAPYVSIKTMAIIMAVIPIVMMITFYFAPESPHFYIRMGDEQNALHSLSAFRRQKDDKIIQIELDLIKLNNRKTKFVNSLKEFCTIPNPKALGIVFICIACQQLSGATTTVLYLEQLYATTDLPFPPNLAVLLTFITANLISLGSIPMSDRWGRKALMLMSSIGCIVSNMLLGIYFQLGGASTDVASFYILPIVAMNFLQISFNFGLNSMPYTVAGEVFSANVKEIALCLVSVGGALCGFTISKLYQVANDSLGTAFVFFGFTILTVIFTLNIFVFVPETKGKSFNEIQELLKVDKNKPDSVIKTGLYTIKDSQDVIMTRI